MREAEANDGLVRTSGKEIRGMEIRGGKEEGFGVTASKRGATL